MTEEGRALQVDVLIEALSEGYRHLYLNNAEFHAFIHTTANNLPLLVDFAAERCTDNQRQAERIARLMREPRL